MRQFNPSILKSNEENPEYAMQYRLGYGTDFLYLFIEVEADSVIRQEDGYRNGDGFMLSLTTPQYDNTPTEEFFILGFYPTRDERDSLKKIIWQYNAEFISRDLGGKCKLEMSSDSGKIAYELLLPWQYVYPYHPWFSEQIGFNIFVSKAIAGHEQNIRGVVFDNRLSLDQNLLQYTRLKFQQPLPDSNLKTYMTMHRNGYEGESMEARFVTCAAKNLREKIRLSILDANGDLVTTEIFEYDTDGVLSFKNYDLKTYELPSGEYLLNWKSLSGNSRGHIELTLFPYLVFENLYDRLTAVQHNVESGSYNTMMFLLNDLHKTHDLLKRYEYVPDYRKAVMEFLDLVKKAEQHNDAISQKRGFFRRAYRVQFDQELYPYSVHIPQNYDPAKKYPLLVYLHEADRDDRALEGHLHYLAGDYFITLAPNGRGARNCYTVKEAQVDIRRAMGDASKHYSIDSTKIILTGYEMGGYGVYRTYYEDPETYAALAVFSGQPDLASHYFPGAGYPNFLYAEILDIFEDTPMFIYHGKQDQTAPFELTVKVAEKLKAIGADVEFVIGEQAGHHPPLEEDIARFRRWLQQRF